MGTSGLFGFRHRGQNKLVYEHCDAYHAGLGCAVTSYVATLMQRVKRRPIELEFELSRVEALAATPDRFPTEQEEFKLESFRDPRLKNPDTAANAWYRLLRKTQGCPAAVLDAGFFQDYSESLGRPGFHYAYIIDFDASMIDCWYMDRKLGSIPFSTDQTAMEFALRELYTDDCDEGCPHCNGTGRRRR